MTSLDRRLEAVAHREQCARILSSWELLAWHSMNANESIPQTRARFQHEMMGLSKHRDPKPDLAPVLWEDVYRNDHERQAKERDARNRVKAKARAKAGSSSPRATDMEMHD